MSRSASIDILLSDVDGYARVDAFLSSATDYGWKVEFNGRINYLPLGDEDFDWQIVSAEEYGRVKSEMVEKYERGEMVGVTLFFVEVALDLILIPETKKYSFIVGANRQELKGCDVVDFSWYLERLLPVFYSLGALIELVECSDA